MMHFRGWFFSFLQLDLATDGANSGIKRNDTNSLEYSIVSIPVNHSRTVEFVVINANPINISIDQISFTVPKARLQLAQMQRLNGSETDVIVKKTVRKDNIAKVRNKNNWICFQTCFSFKLVIPARHRAIFSLTIDGKNDLSFYDETITFKTKYEVKPFVDFLQSYRWFFFRIDSSYEREISYCRWIDWFRF